MFGKKKMLEKIIHLLHLIPLLGLILIIKGMKELKKTDSKTKEWTKLDAKVIKLQDTLLAGSANTLYKPVYKYLLSETEYTGIGSVASYPAAYKVGEQLTILINPKNPKESEIFYKYYIVVPYLSILLGCALFIGGLIGSYYILIKK